MSLASYWPQQATLHWSSPAPMSLTCQGTGRLGKTLPVMAKSGYRFDSHLKYMDDLYIYHLTSELISLVNHEGPFCDFRLSCNGINF